MFDFECEWTGTFLMPFAEKANIVKVFGEAIHVLDRYDAILDFVIGFRGLVDIVMNKRAGEREWIWLEFEIRG